MKTSRIIILFLFTAITLFSEENMEFDYRKVASELSEKYWKQKNEAIVVAKEKGWIIRSTSSDGSDKELQKIDSFGMPVYYGTCNLLSAWTIGTNTLWPGGSTGLDLNGSGSRLGIWDGGTVRSTHIEFTDIPEGSRVTQIDSPAGFSDHATHVAGTLIAGGVADFEWQDNAAIGMAYQAELDAYDYNNDFAEMVIAAGGIDSLILSNHSYGTICGYDFDSNGNWYWYGNVLVDSLEDYRFGFYTEKPRNWDIIANWFPEYLIVNSAGNDRNDFHENHFFINPETGSWEWTDIDKEPDGGDDGYECLPPPATAKNPLTIGAVESIDGGYSESSDVEMSVFSSWGPCDDGRIKPDIVANGVELLSPVAFDDSDPPNLSDNSYQFMSGTSMASPSVCGTLRLIQDHYFQLNGYYMKAATLKGLAINTADEAGPDDGPDYMFGWGLMDSEGSANLVTADHELGDLICEYELENTEIDEFVYYADGTQDITVTISWTDLLGELLEPSLNPDTKMLVNDLDLRLIDQSRTTVYPWKLNRDLPALAATRADNDVDNVEQVFIDDPEAGYYVIQISHKGDIGDGQDYALIVNGMQKSGLWKGTVSSNWHDGDNWSAGVVPINIVDVTIPAYYIHYPNIYAADAECKNITIDAGAALRIYDEQLTVEESMKIFGTLEMWHPSAVLFIYDDICWEDGASATINANNQMKIGGNWICEDGARVQLEDGSVQFMGDESATIYNYSDSCYFNTLGNYISNRAHLEISALSTAPLQVNGDLYLHSNAELFGNSSFPTYLKGNLPNNGTFQFNSGDFIFAGTDQIFNSNAGSYFTNLTINSTGTIDLNNDLEVLGDLRIESGILAADNNQIRVGGSWTNLVGEAGFAEGTGTVKFNGTSNQYCYGETFYTLELDKLSGDLRFPAGSTTICENYNWTEGILNVDGGSFTANDLTDISIFGEIAVTGGELNFHQDGDNYIDLNCDLIITDGSFNIYGGLPNESSYWSYTFDASLSMSGGVLDFKDKGIVVTHLGGNEFNADITGGTIRTTQSFICTRSDYTPAAGTLELYGADDSSLDITGGSSLHDVSINKNSLRELPLSEAENLHQIRDDKSLSTTREGIRSSRPETRSNTVTLESELYIEGDLTIESGYFDCSDLTIYIEGDWNNMAGPSNFMAGNGTVIFYGYSISNILNDETFYDVTVLKTSDNIFTLEIAENTTVHINNDLNILDGTTEMKNNSSIEIDEDLYFAYEGGLNAYADTGLNISVGGDWTNANNGYNTFFGFNPGTSTVTFNGSSEQVITTSSAHEEFYSLHIDKPAGVFYPQDNIHVLGDLLIAGGHWYDDYSYLEHEFYGDFYLTGDGIWDDWTSSISFKGSAEQLFYAEDVNNALFLNDMTIDKYESRVVSTGSDQLTENSNETKDREITRNQTLTLISELKTIGDSNLTIDNGVLDLNGQKYVGTGVILVNSGGTLKADGGSQLIIGDSLRVNSNGLIQLTGTAGTEVLVSSYSGYYDFSVRANGSLSAEYVVFEYMNASGINIKEGAFVEPEHTFDNCTFRNGISGGSLLTINNDQILNIDFAVFPTNTWTGGYNVTKTTDVGQLNFSNSSGDFSGTGNENDPFNRINWLGSIADLTITSVVWSDMEPYLGDTLGVEVTVKNIGSANVVSDFNVDIYQDQAIAPWAGDYGDDWSLINELDAGDSVIVVFDQLTNHSDSVWTSWFQIDSDGWQQESDETNNVWGPDQIFWQSLPVVTDLTLEYISGTGTIELSWSYSVRVDRFLIYRDTNPYFIPEQGVYYSSVTGTINSWSEQVAGGKYFYKVTAERNFPARMISTGTERGRN